MRISGPGPSGGWARGPDAAGYRETLALLSPGLSPEGVVPVVGELHGPDQLVHARAFGLGIMPVVLPDMLPGRFRPVEEGAILRVPEGKPFAVLEFQRVENQEVFDLTIGEAESPSRGGVDAHSGEAVVGERYGEKNFLPEDAVGFKQGGDKRRPPEKTGETGEKITGGAETPHAYYGIHSLPPCPPPPVRVMRGGTSGASMTGETAASKADFFIARPRGPVVFR
mgnify:CR=1 FL=1